MATSKKSKFQLTTFRLVLACLLAVAIIVVSLFSWEPGFWLAVAAALIFFTWPIWASCSKRRRSH